jgi:hypothetical protein
MAVSVCQAACFSQQQVGNMGLGGREAGLEAVAGCGGCGEAALEHHMC